ncbi:MAG: hypothetical protein E7597_03440 [Ruminococcaceae bacterium]|nr:hypothetical protein [Oscillospiraceae bacterium]
MKKEKKTSGAAVFMYSTIALTAVIATVFLFLYYAEIYKNSVTFWIGVVSFTVLYHFGLRIFMGEVTKRFDFDYNHPWFKERTFEKKLYKWLRVRKWKDKVLTFDTEAYNFKNRSLDQLATTMTKSETDHWINEIISVTSIFLALVFGYWQAFIVSAVVAMIFDAQFIVVQRYNRPIVLRLMDRLKTREKSYV